MVLLLLSKRATVLTAKPDMSDEDLKYLFAHIIYQDILDDEKSGSILKQIKDFKRGYTYQKEGPRSTYKYVLEEKQLKVILDYLISRNFITRGSAGGASKYKVQNKYVAELVDESADEESCHEAEVEAILSSSSASSASSPSVPPSSSQPLSVAATGEEEPAKKKHKRGKSKAEKLQDIYAAQGVFLMGGKVVFDQAGVIEQSSTITSNMMVDVTRSRSSTASEFVQLTSPLSSVTSITNSSTSLAKSKFTAGSLTNQRQKISNLKSGKLFLQNFFKGINSSVTYSGHGDVEIVACKLQITTRHGRVLSLQFLESWF